MKTTMRSFKMTRLFQLGMESFESSSVFLSYSKSPVLSKATSFSVLYKAPLFCFMSFYEILLMVFFYTLWTGLVDLSNLLHFLRAQHRDVSRGKKPARPRPVCVLVVMPFGEPHCARLQTVLCDRHNELQYQEFQF